MLAGVVSALALIGAILAAFGIKDTVYSLVPGNQPLQALIVLVIGLVFLII
jgi:hypothetical protein